MSAALPPGNDVAPGWGWSFQILPFLEQEPLYRLRTNPNQPVVASPILAQKLSVYICPSDIQSEPFQVATVKSIGTPSALDRTVMPGSFTGAGLVICSQAG